MSEQEALLSIIQSPRLPNRLDELTRLLHSGASPSTPALFETIRVANIEASELLIASGAPTDSRDENHRTPLICATEQDLWRTVFVLVYSDAEIDAKDNTGMTALMHATHLKRTEIASFLITHGASLVEVDLQGKNALIHSVTEGCLDCTRMLIAATPNIDLADKEGLTALHWAILQDDVILVKALLDQGADPEKFDIKGSTPLHHAVAMKNRQIFDLLLEQDIRISSSDQDGDTPLMIAAFKGLSDFAEILLARTGREGADPNSKNTLGVTALDLVDPSPESSGSEKLISGITAKYGDSRKFVVRGRYYEPFNPDKQGSKVLKPTAEQTRLARIAVKELLGTKRLASHNNPMAANPSSSEREIARRAALLMQTRDAGGKTPLMQACISGDIEAAKLLLDQGAEVNGKDFQGFTSLMLAANAGNLALATLLLEHKASVTVKTPQGFTPLLFAVAKKHPELVKLLIQHESNVNIRIKGMSALMIAASGGALEIVDSLLKAGADAAETNHKGMNAAAIASAQNRDDVAQLITDFLATQNPAKGRR